jgi:predicted transcriptional regulator
MTRKPYKVHAGRVALAELGVTVSAVAALAGVWPSAVSRQLAGDRGMSDPVRLALVELVGAEGLASVLATIPERSEQAAA